LLAYRNIKSNEGSETAGVNHRTIKDWKNAKQEDYVRYVRKRLQNYFPHKVKRVKKPKPNGKIRLLGIPTMEDRLIQQCIKQVLEPILEAKFYPSSYGFRPNRSTMHAINEFVRSVNRSRLYYVIDVDIKGFFDNVNHAKLLKQLWTLGIRDKKLISIISKMLKAEIEKVGKPTKGTPQGGILSPLLSNVVLNEQIGRASCRERVFQPV
jgi:group II intron reverse transcriptase/maturase